MSDNITLPRELVFRAVKALTPMAYDTWPRERQEIVTALRTALAAEQPKYDLMKWAKDAGSSPEDLVRFASLTITDRDAEIKRLREALEKSLTDEQIQQIAASIDRSMPLGSAKILFARRIEAALRREEVKP